MKRESVEKILNESGIEEEKLKVAIDSIMSAHGKAIESSKANLNAKEEEIQKLRESVKNLTESVNKYDGVDVDALKKSVSEWEEKYTKDLKAAQEKLTETIRYGKVKESLTEAGAVDAEYLIYKMGGIDKFAFAEDNQPVGIDELIAPYKSNEVLFKQLPKNKGFSGSTGGTHGSAGTIDYSEMSDEEYYKMKFSK